MASGRSTSATWKRVRAGLLLAVLPAALGLAFVHWPLTASVERSYGRDLLFKLRGRAVPPRDVCVVAIDDASFIERDLDLLLPWPRALYGELVETLRNEGVRAIAFDVLFDRPADPDQDLRFEIGLFDAGNVVLGSSVERTEDPRFVQSTLLEPIEPLAQSAAAVAGVELPPDHDGVIREAFLLPRGAPGLALAAYELATGDRSYSAEFGTRMIDYYGPSRTIETVSLYQAMDPETFLPEGFFRDRIVFIGASQVVASASSDAKDSFPTPFSGGTVGYMYGVEIHATIAANLLEDRRIERLPVTAEAVLLFALAAGATLLFVFLRPVAGAALMVFVQAGVWFAGYQAFARTGLWVPVVIPTLVQLPVAYGAALGWYYLTTVREREKIRRAFSFYLSPEMIKKISENSETLSLGGEEIEGTAVFTDIQGFTSIAEEMTASDTASMLNKYFSEITDKLFDNGGTLIKYIGDAVFAIWGAPVKMKDHARQACCAAVAMAREHETGIAGSTKRLITRVGVHTGLMLVGNLGSTQRFDYTAIGDTINLAARLESLNKSMGTRVLVSGETLAHAGNGLIVRYLGRVRVVGRREPIALHELLGVEGDETPISPAAIARFEASVAAYSAGRLDEADAGFREVNSLCGGRDGPATLYLERIEQARTSPSDEPWDGVINFTKK
ncbi:MAG: adenylate/guanylate cyclase domain-containing protein [Acidobacteriota bacterium]